MFKSKVSSISDVTHKYKLRMTPKTIFIGVNNLKSIADEYINMGIYWRKYRKPLYLADSTIEEIINI